MLDTILDLLKIHGPVGAVLAGVVYIGSRHIGLDRESQKATDARLSALEVDRVVKSDVTRIYERVDRLSTELHEGQTAILLKLTDISRKQ